MSISEKQVESLKNDLKGGAKICSMRLLDKDKDFYNCTFALEYYKQIKDGQFKERLSDKDEYYLDLYNQHKDNYDSLYENEKQNLNQIRNYLLS